MQSGLDRLITAVPDAASSPLALVAYVLALSAWLLVALRVKRNRQILASLKLIPPEQRVLLLESEMGIARLRAGLDPEVWLRSRVHTYYLIAFVVTCVAIVLVVTIALWNPKGTAQDRNSAAPTPASPTPHTRQQVIYMGTARHADQLDILSYIKLGATRRFIEYHAGPPQFEDVVLVTEHDSEIKRTGYAFPKYYLVVTYSPDDEVVQYGVTLRDDTIRVPLPWRPSNELGAETLGNACGSEGCSPSYFNQSAREWVYIETVWYAGYEQNKAGFVAYTDYGAEFTEVLVGMGEDSQPLLTSDVLLKVTNGDKEHLTVKEAELLKRFRASTRPNAYGETTTDFPELKLEESVVDYSLAKRLG